MRVEGQGVGTRAGTEGAEAQEETGREAEAEGARLTRCRVRVWGCTTEAEGRRGHALGAGPGSRDARAGASKVWGYTC